MIKYQIFTIPCLREVLGPLGISFNEAQTYEININLPLWYYMFSIKLDWRLQYDNHLLDNLHSLYCWNLHFASYCRIDYIVKSHLLTTKDEKLTVKCLFWSLFFVPLLLVWIISTFNLPSEVFMTDQMWACNSISVQLFLF